MVIERGQGSRVWDVEGREYLDMIAGIAVVSLGHASPVVQRALAEQSAKLIHISNLYYSIPQLQLAQLLIDHSPFDRVFFGNSGAEANEAAHQAGPQMGQAQSRRRLTPSSPPSTRFHGRTLATVTATGKEAYTRPFTPLPDGFVHVPLNDMDALERAVDATTAAVLLEPIQGESGVHVVDADVPARRAGLLPRSEPAVHGRRGPDGRRTARHVVGLRALGRRARHHDPGQGPRRRGADRRRAGQRVGGRVRAGRPWLDVRRQPADVRGGFAVVTYILENDVLGNVNRVGGVLKQRPRAPGCSTTADRVGPRRRLAAGGRADRRARAPTWSAGHRRRRPAQRDRADHASAWRRR